MADPTGPSSIAKVVVYGYDGDSMSAEDARELYILSIVPSLIDYLHFLPSNTPVQSTSAGKLEVDLPTGVEVVIKIVEVSTRKFECFKFTTPAATGTYYLKDLNPEVVYTV